MALPDEGGRGEKVPVCLHWPGNVCFTSRSVLQVHPVGVLSKEVRRRLRPLHGTFEAAATMYRLRFGVEVGDGEAARGAHVLTQGRRRRVVRPPEGPGVPCQDQARHAREDVRYRVHELVEREASRQGVLP